MKKYIYILFFACAFVLANDVIGQQKNHTAKDNPQWMEIKSSTLTRDSILIGDQVVWSAVFSIPQEKELLFAPYSQAILLQNGLQTEDEILYDKSSNLDIIGELQLDTLAIKNGIKELEAKLLLTSFDSGYYKLPQPIVVSKDGDSIYFDMPSLEVTNVQVDTTNFQMFDIKGQAKYPITFKEIVPWILLALAIIVVAYLIFRYIKYKRENKDFFGKPIVKDPPHIVALRELDKIRNEKLWQSGRQKQYYTSITEAIRAYIEARYGVSAMEKTSSEIISSLSDKKIAEESYNELDSLFKVADLVKFAKYTPSVQENEDAIPIAVRFVNSTFEQQLEGEKIKGEEK